ncbi:hypothetical protein SELMODRAFT_95055 [Selaginella moellendorffii]|uniref:Importin N-terminal domain-containing protein n=1 Tax=Selaginella moellendorffii TaxID=88036 RepID=D8RIY3_SELML|nr:exportin-2 [Selaginella moellendorffii]XP_024531765.1 exportin-2 [Selaginella moellendorffii]EFJ27823.1 hypothetical protein SELMODRAFT_95055 [Selaginella moellendorffii]|eukprot:XP_002971225.1 exportin-2 [Selaginella moellendorffii]
MAVNLSEAFLYTLAPDPEPRKKAELYLANASAQPGYGVAVLQLLGEAAVDDQVRQAAAVHFKNHVKFRWNPGELEANLRIQDSEKEQIKGYVVRLMLSSSPKIQSQLSEALAIISSHDFPSNWKGLLPELVGSLSTSTSYTTINGILQALNSIFKKFRYGYKSVELYTDLKYCLDGFAAPLLEIFTKTGAQIKATQDPATLRPLFECQRLCCRIFYSLNSQELPEFFENHMREWMDEFEYYLMYSNPVLAERDAEKESVVDQLKTAVCENINLYMEKNEEEFRDYLQRFATDVWNLLMSTSLQPAHDRLAMSAMKFLTTVSKSVHHALFSGADTLRQICESIAIPNVRIRAEDEELFELNPLEYIRRDIEGSDTDTRRRIACELVKGLMLRYRDQVTGLVSGYLGQLGASYSANPTGNWKDKDTAIYLIVALAQKQPLTGAVTTDLVNVEQFLASQINPELRGSTDILVADALKFITTFRSAVPKPVVLELMPQIIQLLVSSTNVVHSYAAGCVEKLLLVRDGGVPRYSSADLAPFQSQLLANALSALQFPDSQENPYVMKCIMRVLSVAEVGPMSVKYLDDLVGILGKVCRNPTNPTFNHYIFESVSVLVRKACERDQEVVMAFEGKLFPVFQFILQNDVAEFQPYAFQILAQLIESRGQPIPREYLVIFPVLIDQRFWQKSANVPAIIRLLQAFLLKAPREIAQGNQLQEVYNVFSRLVSRKSTEDYAFYIANAMVESLSQDLLMPIVPHLWTAFFSRLMGEHRTVKFLKLLVLFMSLFTVKHGQAVLVDSVNKVSPTQPRLFVDVLQQFWIPTLSSISGSIETKLCAVASTRLLCESALLLAEDQLWGKLLNNVVVLLVRPEEERVAEETDVPELDQVTGYGGVYAQLHHAGKKDDDPLKEIKDAKEYLCHSLNRLSMQYPGKFPGVIQQHLDAGNQEALRQMCNAYRTTIV